MNIERGLLLAICLGVINIGFNTAVYKTVLGASTFAQAIMSPMFWVAFAIGTMSLMCMLGMYFSKFSLAQGILIAGATSILLGTLWGSFFSKTHLSTMELVTLGSHRSFLRRQIYFSRQIMNSLAPQKSSPS